MPIVLKIFKADIYITKVLKVYLILVQYIILYEQDYSFGNKQSFSN